MTFKQLSMNRPRCPVCEGALRLWAVRDSVRAECPGCGWEWSE